MAYQPTFGPLFPPATSIIGAIPVAAFGASVIGTALVLAYLTADFLVTAFNGGLVAGEAHYLPLILLIVGVGCAFAIIAATFLTSFYLLVSGMPVAALMRTRLKGPIGLAFSITVAAFAALVFMGLFSVHPENLLDYNLEGAGLVFAYALPAGILYRRTVLSLLEELD